MKPAPTRAHCCCFCNRDIDEVELLFLSSIGGIAPAICSTCIDQFGEVVTAHRQSPAHAAMLVEATNAVAAAGEG